MAYNRPSPPTKPASAPNVPKPYQLVSFPQKAPVRNKPIGQDSYKNKRLSGKISLRLTVKTASFIASGVVAMGNDLSNRYRNIPLIKVSVGQGEKLILPGSSLKGVIRSIYEAITLSCLCKTKASREKIPNGYSECKTKENLCPACQVFGAMGWQGLISFQDAVAEEIKPSVGFMPSLYSPRDRCRAYYHNGKVAGRKFYYHAIKAVDKGQQQGIPVQQAGTNLIFTTQLRFMNLTEAELGTLLTSLGQDTNNAFAIKIGGGKPIGMGTMVVEITQINCFENIRDRYLDYNLPEQNILIKDKLQNFIKKVIQSAQNGLIQKQQLNELKQVLQFPTNREAPEGMY